MKKAKYLLAVFAVMTIITAGIGKTWAYFTTYTEAEGGYTIRMGNRTEIKEDFSNWKKRLVVSNTGQGPVFVRAKVFNDSIYDVECSGEGWELNKDGYYYYKPIVDSGEDTAELIVEIKNVPNEVTEGDAFNVIIIYESTPVLYHEDGSPYADWTAKVDTGTAGSGEGGGEG